MHAELGGEVQVVGERVAAADGVEAVRARAGGEAELLGGHVPVDREADAGERPRAERRGQGGRDRVAQPRPVAVEHPHVREQVVRQPNRLGPLAVRVTGQDRVDVGLGLGEQRLAERAQPLRLPHRRGPQVQQRVGDDLVVAAPGRVEPPPGVADELGQAALDGGVDVLVARGERERAVGELAGDPLQALVDGGGVGGGDDPPGAEHPGVRARGRDVLRPHAPVDRQRGVDAVEGLIRAGAEAAAPQAPAPGHARAPAADRCPVIATASAPHTRSTCASVISGKNGSAIVEELIASVTGNSPGRCPCSSW